MTAPDLTRDDDAEACVRLQVERGFGRLEAVAWVALMNDPLASPTLLRVAYRALHASHPAGDDAPDVLGSREVARDDLLRRAARLERLEAHGETIVEELVAAPTARTFSRLVAGYRRRYVTPAMETWFAGVVERALGLRNRRAGGVRRSTRTRKNGPTVKAD